MEQSETIGMWIQTWAPGNNLPEGINTGIAFNGWVNISDAISNSSQIFDKLPPFKYLSLGGGNASGAWTEANLSSNLEAINNGDIDAYDGIVFDCEIGEGGLYDSFNACFAALKAKDKKVIFTTSHTGPYGFLDAEIFMTSILACDNIDVLSPQLYTNGTEPENDYSAGDVPWSQWETTTIPIAPSIVTANLYPDAVEWFKNNLNITLQGFIQWENLP